jgi:hypothetical protein
MIKKVDKIIDNYGNSDDLRTKILKPLIGNMYMKTHSKLANFFISYKASWYW